MTQTRVNITTKVNSASIRRERRNGRDVIIVPSATMPDDIVMNGVFYPADEIAKSYMTLNKTPAPLGHPTIEGAFVSAKEPEGLARGWVGAWNENVRRENGRVLIDKVIDVDVASQLTGGKAVLAAIEKGQPIHTSTGLYAMFSPVENGPSGATYSASDIIFDHDAILIGEDGAATPAQGVGMMVNKALSPSGESVGLVNSSMVESADDEINWAIEHLARAVDRRKNAGLMEQMKSAILALFGQGSGASQLNEKDTDMTVTKEAFDALSDQVKALSEGMANTVGDAVKAAMAPVLEAQAKAAANQAAADEAELADLRGKIVKANLLDESAAGELTLNAARALSKAATLGKAAPIANGFTPSADKITFTAPE